MNYENENKIQSSGVQVYYGENRALHGIDLNIGANEVTALIGPSGCGKSTFLRCINRMNDVIDGCRVKGSVFIDGDNIYADHMDVVELRARVGMVFQKPNPFPKSVYDNVAYGPRIHRLAPTKEALDHMVETSLKRAGLWQEVHDRLSDSSSVCQVASNSVCALRAIAVNPEVVLMDEPCLTLNPFTTAVIEELIEELKSEYTIVIVTHSMQQASRVSQKTAYFHLGNV